MRLGTCLLPEGLTLQGAHHKLAGFCSALVAGYYAAVDNPGDGHISLVDAKKRDSASGSQSHYVGHLRFHSDDCGQHSIPVAGPVAGDGLSLRLAAHVPAGTGCATDNWGLGEFGFTFERANPDFVPSAVNLSVARSQGIGVPESQLPICPDWSGCRNRKSPRNWSAITPQSPFPAWPEYLLTWPGLDRSAPIFDAAGNEIPAFATDPAGVGVWWYWLHRRAGGTGVADPASVSLVRYRDRDGPVWMTSRIRRHRDIATNYIALSAKYTESSIDADTQFDLGDPLHDGFWRCIMFHHESGRLVELPLSTFEAGVRLGNDVMNDTFTSLDDYRDRTTKDKRYGAYQGAATDSSRGPNRHQSLA